MPGISYWMLSYVVYDNQYGLEYLWNRVYMIIFSGWSSKSKYRLIGSIRSIAITLRFELCMAIVFLSPVFMINTLSLNIFDHYYLNSMLYTSSVLI